MQRILLWLILISREDEAGRAGSKWTKEKAEEMQNRFVNYSFCPNDCIIRRDKRRRKQDFKWL